MENLRRCKHFNLTNICHWRRECQLQQTTKYTYGEGSTVTLQSTLEEHITIQTLFSMIPRSTNPSRTTLGSSVNLAELYKGAQAKTCPMAYNSFELILLAYRIISRSAESSLRLGNWFKCFNHDNTVSPDNLQKMLSVSTSSYHQNILREVFLYQIYCKGNIW